MQGSGPGITFTFFENFVAFDKHRWPSSDFLVDVDLICPKKVEYEEKCDTKYEEQCETTQVRSPSSSTSIKTNLKNVFYFSGVFIVFLKYFCRSMYVRKPQ